MDLIDSGFRYFQGWPIYPGELSDFLRPTPRAGASCGLWQQPRTGLQPDEFERFLIPKLQPRVRLSKVDIKGGRRDNRVVYVTLSRLWSSSALTILSLMLLLMGCEIIIPRSSIYPCDVYSASIFSVTSDFRAVCFTVSLKEALAKKREAESCWN